MSTGELWSGLQVGAGPSDAEREEFLRRLRELREQDPYEPDGLIEEVFEPDTVVESWLSGELALHFNVRIRAGLPDVDPADFCADLQCTSGEGRYTPRHAVRGGDSVHGPFWKGPDWLYLTVLVVVDQGLEGLDASTRDIASACLVRLVLPDDCQVCGTNAREPLWYRGFEFVPIAEERKMDGPKLFLGEVGGLAAPNKRPSDVVERTSLTVDEVAEMQTPCHRGRVKPLHGQHERVEFRVVLMPNSDGWISAGVSGNSSLERLAMSVRPTELQPRAVELTGQGGLDLTSLRPEPGGDLS